MGFAYVTNLRQRDIVSVVEDAVSLARVSIPDPDFESLPSLEGSYPRVRDVFDPTVVGLASDEAAELVVRAVDAVLEEAGSYKVATEGQLHIRDTERAIVNSLGIVGSERGTAAWLYCYPTVRADGDQTTSCRDACLTSTRSGLARTLHAMPSGTSVRDLWRAATCPWYLHRPQWVSSLATASPEL